MGNSTYLEDFSLSQALTTQNRSGESDKATEIRLAGFEAGYEAGYEDASKLSKENDGRVDSELSAAISEIRFGFKEARRHILASLAPVINEVFSKLLPEMAQKTLQARLEEMVRKVLEVAADGPIAIQVNPKVKGDLTTRLTDQIEAPFRIEAEPSLSLSEAAVCAGHSGLHLDLDETVTEILRSVDAFFSQEEKDAANA